MEKAPGKNSFTLIELLIVIGIMLLLTAVTVPIYGMLQVSSQLNENSSQAVQALRIAKERSMSRFNNSSHGVYFETNLIGEDKYVLYQGVSYAARESSYDREYVLDDVLKLSWSLLGVGDEGDINFSKGLGVPGKTGTIILIHDVSGARSIIINNLGAIEEN